MKTITSLAVLLCISGQILAREDRLSSECLNGIADRDKCCKGVPDAWYAHLRNPEDCSSFYQCEHEKATWKACPAGLEWSVKEDKCDWPTSAKCKTGNDNDESNESGNDGGSNGSSSEEGNNGGDKPELPAGCYDGSIDAATCCEGISAWYVHLPDPNNCGKFFHCDNGKVVHKDCPAGLHWSVKEDKCEWPNVAGCEGNPAPTTTQKPSTTQRPTTQQPATTQKPTTQKPTTQRPTTQEPTTQRPTTQEPTTQRPTTQEPTTQRPTTQEPTTQRPTTQEPTTQRPTTQEPTTQRPTTQEPTTQRPTTQEPTTSAPPTTSPPPAEDQCIPEPVCHQCLSGVFPADLCCRDVETYHKLHLANGKDCSSYYTCVDGHAVIQQCPEGLQWSIDTDRCEWPVDAKCEANDGGDGNEGGNSGEDGGNNSGENGNGGASNDCLNGKLDAKACCQNVPYWVDVLLQNNDDCHTYFQCVHGVPMVRPCPSNLWWSITANRCEWKENATCTW